MVTSEMRGKHGNDKTVDNNIKNGVRDHINSIPKIEATIHVEL